MSVPVAVTPLEGVTVQGAASLRIAQVAPPYFSVPPDGYGGVELIVANLVDGLVDRGHHVTLIGAGRQLTKAQRYLSTSPHLSTNQLGELLPEIAHAARVGKLLEDSDFDLVHDHTAAGPLLALGRTVPTIVTVHGPVTGTEATYYEALAGSVRLIAISDAQRATAPDLQWYGTVHNGVDIDSFPYCSRKEDFALFLGRFHPHKAPHLAIDAAREAGLPIVLSGKCLEPVEQAYFKEHIAPRLGPDVTMFGMADAAAKRDLLARSACLIFPICWEEPFGLVMIEAMACGTPVVALRRGSVPEIVLDGITGVICDEAPDLAEGIALARRLDPADCRNHARQAFDASAMISGYEQVYRRALAQIRRPQTPTAMSGGLPPQPFALS